jgi:hypothetical protein
MEKNDAMHVIGLVTLSATVILIPSCATTRGADLVRMSVTTA